MTRTRTPEEIERGLLRKKARRRGFWLRGWRNRDGNGYDYTLFFYEYHPNWDQPLDFKDLAGVRAELAARELVDAEEIDRLCAADHNEPADQ